MGFSIHVKSKLYPDEGNTFLHVIYEVVSTTFGGNIPTGPQWSGPPRATVQGDAFLCANIAVSLFSVFLAVLAEFVLYIPFNARGPTSRHNQNGQQKLKVWLFHHLAELIPSTTHAALVLFSYGMSRHASEFNATIALAILGVTYFAIGLYLLNAVALAASPDFTQTIESRIIRWAVLVISSAFRRALKYFKTTRRSS